jgi:hypothetical protein
MAGLQCRKPGIQPVVEARTLFCVGLALVT